MSQILKVSQLDQVLLEKGYIVIPLLNESENTALLKFYHEHHDFNIEQMYASAHSDDLTYRQRMSNGIAQVVEPKLHNHFRLENIKALGGSFIVKGSSKNATLPPHQDWNIVDEKKHRSFNLWLPLVNTSEENGGLNVLPGSHLWHETFRGPNISSAYENVVDDLLPYHEMLSVPAGHAVLYDHRLLHASGPNYSDHLRIVAVIGIIEANADMYIYYRNENNIEAYRTDASFFMTSNPQEGPRGLTLEKSFAWHFPSYNTTDLKKILSGNKHIDSPVDYFKTLIKKWF